MLDRRLPHLVAALFFAGVSAAFSQTAPAEPRVHDRAFWRGIVDADYAVPEGESAAALLRELDGFLGSPDPELRDELGYMISFTWIQRDRRFAPAELREHLEVWKANLQKGLGETGTDTVFLRSFSALNLSTLAALDNEQPFLEAADFRALLDAGLAYLAGERDLRGFDPAKGWIHATGHTADLLAALAASRHLQTTDHLRLLTAVSARMETAGQVLVWGEDERLAKVVQALVLRKDFEAKRLDLWLEPFPMAGRKLWENGPRIDPARYVAVQNGKNLLRSLYVLLDAVPTEGEAELAKQKLHRVLGEV